MTVKELISQLEKMPQDMTVAVGTYIQVGSYQGYHHGADLSVEKEDKRSFGFPQRVVIYENA